MVVFKNNRGQLAFSFQTHNSQTADIDGSDAPSAEHVRLGVTLQCAVKLVNSYTLS